MNRIERIANYIKEYYNPGRDVPQDGIQVSWCDKALLDMIEYQQAQIEHLKMRINSLDGLDGD